MRLYTVFILLMPVLLTACNNDGITTNKEGNNVFTYEPIGWQMVLPDNWQVLTESERDKVNYAAQNYYEEENTKNKGGVKKIILGIKKEEKDMNACYAFVRTYQRDEDYPNLRDLLHQQKRQYSTDNYDAQDTLIKETIGSLEFEKAVLTVYYAGKPYFTYTTYSTMIDTLNFGVSIVTNNAADEQLLTNNFRESVSSINK